MSRLIFKETKVIPLDELGYRREESSANGKSPGGPKITSDELTSYELYDLMKDDDGSPSQPPLNSSSIGNSENFIINEESKTNSNAIIAIESSAESIIEVLDDSSDDNTDLPESRLVTTKSMDKINERSAESIENRSMTTRTPHNSALKQSASPHEILSISESTAMKDANVSSFLSRFLSQKRSLLDVEPPPIEISNDTYLKLFHEEHQKKSSTTSLPDLERANSDPFENNADISFSQFIVTNEGLLTEDLISDNDSVANISISSSAENGKENISGEEIGLKVAEEASSERKFLTVHLFNLPYDMGTDGLLAFLRNSGLQPKSIILGSNSANGVKPTMPPGSAAVEIYIHKKLTLSKVINKINGKMCGSRPVRAQTTGDNTRKRLSFGKDGNSRYFEGPDISCKCNLCGEVGHRQQECTNDPLPPPCHLCAATNHEPGECPNIICYRCGLFGHHSRDCTNQSRPKPTVCVECGSFGHDVFRHHDYEHLFQKNENVFESKIEGSWIKCMICNQSGHTLCQKKIPKPETSNDQYFNVYCPNCGEKGHHIDYRPYGRRAFSYEIYDCTIPKYDAFFRYPQLTKEIDSLLGKDYDYYARFVNRKDDKLFPIFNARKLKPLDAPLSSYHKDWISTKNTDSSNDEEDDNYFHEEDSDEESSNSDEEDYDDDDDESDSDENYDYEDDFDDDENEEGEEEDYRNHGQSKKRKRSEQKNSNKKQQTSSTKKDRHRQKKNKKTMNQSNNRGNHVDNGAKSKKEKRHEKKKQKKLQQQQQKSNMQQNYKGDQKFPQQRITNNQNRDVPSNQKDFQSNSNQKSLPNGRNEDSKKSWKKDDYRVKEERNYEQDRKKPRRENEADRSSIRDYDDVYFVSSSYKPPPPPQNQQQYGNRNISINNSSEKKYFRDNSINESKASSSSSRRISDNWIHKMDESKKR